MKIFSIRMKCTITPSQDQGKKNQDRDQGFGENKLKKKKKNGCKNGQSRGSQISATKRSASLSNTSNQLWKGIRKKILQRSPCWAVRV